MVRTIHWGSGCAVVLCLMLVTPLRAATRTWSGAVSGDWGLAGNWVENSIPADGDDLVFPIAIPTNQVCVNTLTGLRLRSLIFSNPALTGTVTLAGNAFVLDASYGAPYTLSNANKTAGSDITISNDIAVAGDQLWSGNGDKNAVVVFAGNLSGAGTVTITNVVASTGNTAKPPIRFSGTNSGYAGTLRLGGSGAGLWLLSPAAMIGGLIDANTLDGCNLHLAGNGAATPYRFATDNAAGTANFDCRNSGSGGVYLNGGGDVYWDPSHGTNYVWPAGSAASIRIEGSADATPRMLYFGNSNGNLVLTGDRTLASAGNNTAGNNPGHVTILYALEDDASGGHLFNIEAFGTILTRSAVENGAAHSRMAVNSPGMLAVSSMNQIFSGNLLLNNGGLILDRVTWGSFVSNRSAGYGASIPAGSQPGTITAAEGGSLVAGAYAYRVVAVTAAGTSAAGLSRSGTTSGTKLTLPVSWAAQTGAIRYRLYRHAGAASFAVGDLIYEGNGLAVADGGLPALQTDVTLPVSDTTVADHAWAFTSAGGGLAARGVPVTIDDQGTDASTFDRNVFLGSTLRQSDGSTYADAAVILDRGDGRETLALSATTDRSIANVGCVPMIGADGYYELGGAGPVNEIAGRITGGGPGRRWSLTGAGSKTSAGLLRLSNTGNTFQATVSIDNGGGASYGVVIATDDGVFGNAANPVSIRAEFPASASGGQLLLFENQDAGQKRFGRPLIVTNGSINGSVRTAGFGAYAGGVVYTGTVDCVGVTNAGDLMVNVHVESDAVLTLGDGSVPATLLNDRGPGPATNAYRKTGPGTLVLQNLVCPDRVGNGHYLQIGRTGGGVMNYTGPYVFDGAVRETGNGPTNSFANQNILLAGGVLETCDALLGGPFTRSVGTGANQVRWAANSGGGFSAYGGPLTVNLYGLSPASNLAYNTAAFMSRKQSLMFGSRTADNVVTWLNPQVLSGSVADAAEIRVIDNPLATADRAVIAGAISGGVGGNDSYLSKGGDGVLEFAAGVTNVYTSPTRVYDGVLLVNGVLDARTPSAPCIVYVMTNAILGGTGTILRPVVLAGGILAPGDAVPNGVVGTLTVSNLTMAANSALRLDLGPTNASDRVLVQGNLSLAGVINVTNTTGFTEGAYEVMTYGGALTATATLGAMPKGYTATLDTNTTGKVILSVRKIPDAATVLILR